MQIAPLLGETGVDSFDPLKLFLLLLISYLRQKLLAQTLAGLGDTERSFEQAFLVWFSESRLKTGIPEKDLIFTGIPDKNNLQ
ncbi:hypothetical protein [Rufibacter roseus]|uniref:Uncharacterized protein n=1 Tax=Rufibacter roseus TaxID=1567108 RepID=A0ABW2DHM5_9BACT|nr:hypothetical protein [Rufibacter roseus]